MKLKIWNEENVKNSEDDQLFLKLDKCPSHEDIHLVACDKEGKEIKQGTVLIVDQDLKGIILLEGVSDSLNLKTDFDGMVLTLSESEVRHRHQHSFKVEMLGKIMSSVVDQNKEQVQTH